MLHQTNFLLETERNFYFINTSMKRIEHIDNAEVTANPINNCKIELDMRSISKPVADDNQSAFMNPSNGETTDLDISLVKISNPDDKLNNDCEFNIDTKYTEATGNERQARLRSVNVSDFEVCTTSLRQPTNEDSNALSVSSTRNFDLPRDSVVANSDIAPKTRTNISYSLEIDGHVVRDIPVYEGVTSEDKLPIVSGGSAGTEDSPKLRTSLANEMNLDKLSLETTVDQLKMRGVKDNKNIPEGQESSVVDVKGFVKERLAQLHQDDKCILEESFILYSSSLGEKHVCNPLDWDQNVKRNETGSKSEECISEPSGLSLDKMEIIVKVPAEDSDKHREADVLSVDQKETLLATPATKSEKESGHDSDFPADCLNERLDSSTARTHCLEHSPVETVMEVHFSQDNDSRVELLSSSPRSDKYFNSHDIDKGEGSGVASADSHSNEGSGVASADSHSNEGSALKVQSSTDEGEIPNGETLEMDNKCRKISTVVDKSPLQVSPFFVSQKDHTLAAGDLASEGCSKVVTSSLEPVTMEKLQDSFSSNPGICQEDSRLGQEDSRGETVVVTEEKSTVDTISPDSLYTIKESNKSFDLTETGLIDPEVTNCDTSNKSAGDNIPVCELVNINAATYIQSESKTHLVDSGFPDHAVVEGKTEESLVVAEHKSAFNDQDTLPLTHTRKDYNGTSHMTKTLLIDSTASNHSPSEKFVGNNISGPAFSESDTKKNVRQRSAATPGFAGHPVSSVYAGQNFQESLPDAFDDINGNNDVAESARYTFSGPINFSGPISYSGPIPVSGSVSLRSDSSTTSTRSFAFPTLASDWNSSPVKMAQADPRYYRKKRAWNFFCFCGGSRG